MTFISSVLLCMFTSYSPFGKATLEHVWAYVSVVFALLFSVSPTQDALLVSSCTCHPSPADVNFAWVINISGFSSCLKNKVSITLTKTVRAYFAQRSFMPQIT